jgi:hypothetical protein
MYGKEQQAMFVGVIQTDKNKRRLQSSNCCLVSSTPWQFFLCRAAEGVIKTVIAGKNPLIFLRNKRGRSSAIHPVPRSYPRKRVCMPRYDWVA